MNINDKLEKIETELGEVLGQAWLLQSRADASGLFHERITMPLKSLVALAENVERELYVEA